MAHALSGAVGASACMRALSLYIHTHIHIRVYVYTYSAHRTRGITRDFTTRDFTSRTTRDFTSRGVAQALHGAVGAADVC